MLFRTIMIFPQFNNENIINAIRKKYDPLYNLVKPHITLVFPFQDKISNIELEKKLEECFIEIPPFKIILQGISRQKDNYGNYIFLNVKQGERQIIDIHNNLYRNIWKQEQDERYIPHMTLGKFQSEGEMMEAYKDVKDLDSSFETFVDKISVEEIGRRGESFVVIEKHLYK